MYARITTIEGDPARVDAGIAFALDRVRPVIEAAPGNRGFAVFVDRDNGRLASTSAWATEEAREASDALLAPLRAEAARELGGQQTVDLLELGLVERVRRAEPGCWARSTKIQGAPGDVDRAIAHYRAEVLPALRGMSGFCSALVLVDRATGAGLGTTTWDSREALEQSRTDAAQLRTGTAASTGARILDVREHEIVWAGITGLNRHEMLFRRAYRAMSAGGDVDDLAAVVAPDFVDHGPVPPGTPPGLAGLKQLMMAYREAFPDVQVRLEEYFERGDRACAAMRITGTNTGPLMGMPPTGRSIDITGVDVVRFGPDGRCVEHWGGSDDLGMLTQLGLFAPPEAPATIDLPEQERSSGAPAAV